MKSIRFHCFETNSSSEHAFAIYDRADWNKLKDEEVFVTNPYSVNVNLVSLKEAKEILIGTLKENIDSSDEDTKKSIEKAIEIILDNDEITKKIITEPFNIEEILNDDNLCCILDELKVYSYESAYGDTSEFYLKDDSDENIYIRNDTVIVNGTYRC